jgi:hypothetical protein
MKPSYRPLRQALVLAAGAAAALAASTAAHAEYRCRAPADAAEQRACALARLDHADELRRYVERTRNIYGLYMPDYVSAADVARWERTRAPQPARGFDVAARGQGERQARE